MRERPFKKCALCLEDNFLCDSHLIPASIVRLLQAKGRKNPNPLHVGYTGHYTTSKPFMDYLLCENCEDRFSKRGEQWVAQNCCRGGRFRIREALRARTADAVHDGISLYSAASVPGIDTDRLAYFALSVIWRAGVHEWNDGHRAVHLDLGPYLEPIRLHLRDERPFPDRMSLILRVSSLDPCIARVAFGDSKNFSGYRLHGFAMMGLTFMLQVGKKVDGSHPLCTYPSPGRFIGFAPDSDREDVLSMWRKHEIAIARGLKPNPKIP